MSEKIRLDKFISSQRQDLSRSIVKTLCRKGSVKVNGEIVKKPETSVSADDCITVNGEKINYRKYMYIMMNKPQGVVCSTKDGVSKTVLELVPQELLREGLFPAGRLDKDTEGFVLLTDDGELAHRMLSPKSHVPKTYFVRLENKWADDYKAKIAKGLIIDGNEKCLPADFEGSNSSPFECTIILHEGKFHQVKRMFAALGNKVIYLKRVQIGSLHLNSDLALGECMEIMHKDVERLLLKN